MKRNRWHRAVNVLSWTSPVEHRSRLWERASEPGVAPERITAVKEKISSEITRLPEEDLALVGGIHPRRILSGSHFFVFIAMSALVLSIYLLANHLLFPGYPVVTGRAESDAIYEEHYPPFRMGEWANFAIAKDLLDGRFFSRDSLSRKHPVGFPAVSAPLARVWGEAGPYYTNAFLLWAAALVFFFILLDMVSFPVATGATLCFALATPNVFYAASAFSEPPRGPRER